MNKYIFIVFFLLLFISCRETEKNMPSSVTDKEELVADDIIYDVIIKTESDDPWELEKIAGYRGTKLVDQLFEGIYSGKFEVVDYHSREKMGAGDIRKIEKQAGFERDNIGKIQFRENWYFNSLTMHFDKEIISVVPGYISYSEDLGRTGYKAKFEVIFK